MTHRDRTIKLSDLEAINASFAKREHELVLAAEAALRDVQALAARVAAAEDRLVSTVSDASRASEAVGETARGLDELRGTLANSESRSGELAATVDAVVREVADLRGELHTDAQAREVDRRSAEDVRTVRDDLERLAHKLGETESRVEIGFAATARTSGRVDHIEAELAGQRAALESMQVLERIAALQSHWSGREERLSERVDEVDRTLRTGLESSKGRLLEIRAGFDDQIERVFAALASERQRLAQFRDEWRLQLDDIARTVRHSADQAAETKLATARQVADAESRLLDRQTKLAASVQEVTQVALEAVHRSDLQQRAWTSSQVEALSSLVHDQARTLAGADAALNVAIDAVHREQQRRLDDVEGRVAVESTRIGGIEDVLQRLDPSALSDRIGRAEQHVDALLAGEAVREESLARLDKLESATEAAAAALVSAQQSAESTRSADRGRLERLEARVDAAAAASGLEREALRSELGALRVRIDGIERGGDAVRDALQRGLEDARIEAERALRASRDEIVGQVERLVERLTDAEHQAEALKAKTDAMTIELAQIKGGWGWRLASLWRPSDYDRAVYGVGAGGASAKDAPRPPLVPARTHVEPPVADRSCLAATAAQPSDQTDRPAPRLASAQQHQDMTANPSPHPYVARNLDELMALHDESFVRSAYLTILGRRPDPDGFATYLALVREGADKMQIVASLACSDEGRAIGSGLPGLGEGVERWLRNGGLVRRLRRRLAAPVDPSIEARLRAIENRLAVLADEALPRAEASGSLLAERVASATQQAILELNKSVALSVAMAMKPVVETIQRLGIECTSIAAKLTDLERRVAETPRAALPDHPAAERSGCACLPSMAEVRPVTGHSREPVDSNTLMERVRAELRAVRGE